LIGARKQLIGCKEAIPFGLVGPINYATFKKKINVWILYLKIENKK